MDKNIIGGLINSISRLIHLVACQNTKSSDLKGIRYIVCVLKLLKPVLHEILDTDIPSHEQLTRELEELDIAVNKSREFMEKRSHKMSKIYSVLQTKPMVLKVRESSMKICYILSILLQSSSTSSQLAVIQHSMQELQCVEQDLTVELIDVALKAQRENVRLDNIIKIMETLGLTSPQELLAETISLEKQRVKAELEENTEILDYIGDIIALVSHIRYCMATFEQFGVVNGAPVPSYFRCPLSLELMLDPVIVASGQTYERSFIQKWLDNGLRNCPRTRQALDHTNLTPNFTVKALIVNWCEDNNIRLHDCVQLDSIVNPFVSSISLEDFSPGNSFRGSTHRDSISRSSAECMEQPDQQRSEICLANGGDRSNLGSHHKKIIENVTSQGDISSEQQSCIHSCSESISSVISSTDISSKYDEKVCLLEAAHPSSSPSNDGACLSSWLSVNQLRVSPSDNDGRDHCLVPDTGSDYHTTASHVNKLIQDLESCSPELQSTAASELRRLAKHNMENRVLIAKCGAIAPLLSLLTSKVKKIQENAVTALLNLSLNERNKISIAEAGAIEPLIHVLECGTTEARENSAATFFSLSVLEEYKAKVGRSGAVKALVNLLGSGSLRGRKDAATALFNLSIFHENKARIVRAGAVKHLVELMDPDTGMADKSVALLANLSTIPEGRVAISHEGGIPLLVETLETGTQRGKENAASALFQMCINSPKFSSLVLQEGAVPPLVALSQFGTPRAKEKAQQILSHFRSQREGTARKPKA